MLDRRINGCDACAKLVVKAVDVDNLSFLTARRSCVTSRVLAASIGSCRGGAVPWSALPASEPPPQPASVPATTVAASKTLINLLFI